MQKALPLYFALLFGTCFGAIAAQDAGDAPQSEIRPETIKQNVFVFCPHVEGKGAWSLYVLCDKNNPSKLLALGLEELPGKNSKELSYKGVLEAQKNVATPRNELARLDAKNFASGSLDVKENNMLSIKVNQAPEGLKLTVDARISLDGRFVVGAGNHGELILQYSNLYKVWQTKALKLEDNEGRNVVGKYSMTLSGIVFSAGMTRVSRICAVDEFGCPTCLMDR